MQLATYSLIRAVYNDRFDQARDILKANPEQINLQEPFAGLTALHIAIFRHNEEIVKLLAEHPRCDIGLKDNFQRTALDMMVYTTNQAIFDTVMQRAYTEQERAWAGETFKHGATPENIISLSSHSDK